MEPLRGPGSLIPAEAAPVDPARPSRRDVLRLLAGIPLVCGLGGLARGAEGDLDDLRRALAAARRAGRPLLLIACPPLKLHPPARIKALAEQLEALLRTYDEDLRLALTNLVIVVAEAEALLAAGAALPDAAAVAGRATVWLEQPRLEDAAAGTTIAVFFPLDAGAEAADGIGPWLVEQVLVPEALAARRAHELGLLDAAGRPAVEDALRDLGHASWERREQASAALTGRREALLGALTHAALTHADAEGRYRARALARLEDVQLEPLGAVWSNAPREDPCPTCGMAVITPAARRYLHLRPVRR